MQTKVLFRPGDQLDTITADAMHKHSNGRTYKLVMEISAMPALASIPCQRTGKSTRSILEVHDVVIQEKDDSLVNVYDQVARISDETETLEPTHVVVITGATIMSIRDESCGLPVSLRSELAKEFDNLVNGKLRDQVVGNTEIFDLEYLSSLIK